MKKARAPFVIDPHADQFRWGPIPGSLLFISHWKRHWTVTRKRLHQYYWPENYIIFHQRKMLFVNESKPLVRLCEKVFRKELLTKRRSFFWRSWQSSLRNLLEYTKRFTPTFIRRLSNSELLAVWRSFNRLTDAIWEPGIIPEMAAYGGASILERALRKAGLDGAGLKRALAILSAPTQPSFYQEEEIDALRCALLPRRSERFEKTLTRHAESYAWIDNSYFRVNPREANFFRKRILLLRAKGSRKALSRILRQFKEIKRQQRRILHRLPNQQAIRRISEGLSFAIWWQDQRKKFIFWYLTHFDSLVREIERRARVSPHSFDVAWHDEVTVTPSPQLLERLRQRRSGTFVVHTRKNRVDIYTGRRAKIIKDAYWRRLPPPPVSVLEGVVTFAARRPVRGVAFVMRSLRDLLKFPSGRILVTAMTAPEYVVAMRKAKAIVTDEGGITSHAAITSRELKVPCIVGTRFATSVLKTGDRVEVNAAQGIVKKL